MRVDLVKATGLAKEGNHEAIKKVFSVAAKAMREDKPVPQPVAAYLADALEVAGPKPPDNQGQTLLEELGLLFWNRPPSQLDRFKVAMQFVSLRVFRGLNSTESIEILSGDHEVSESTIRRALKDQEAYAMVEAMVKEFRSIQNPSGF